MNAGNKELAGRVALVTGAGRNIGRAIALALAADGAGVVVNARANQAEAAAVVNEIEAQGGKALAAIADVCDAAAVETMVAAAIARFGRIDFLISNAAVRREQPLEEITLADWHAILRVVLDGAFNCTKACLPHLKASGAGAIVTMGGLSWHRGSKERAHVMTAKAGLVGFTRALAHDLAADNVTANCVAPGLIDTARGPGAPVPQHHSARETLAGRRGTAEEIAATVRFLCGPTARYITGQTIHVNGGAFMG